MSNKFIGLAYWSVATKNGAWLKLAAEVLRPLDTESMAEVRSDENSLQIFIGNPKEVFEMRVFDGKGRGVVRQCSSAATFIVCLVAMRKTLGDISIRTDSTEEVPRRIFQGHPLYADDWPRVKQVAEALGLMADEAFYVRHQAVLGNVF